jgi:hypothetical protein
MVIKSAEQMGATPEMKNGVVRRGLGFKNEICEFLIADYHGELVERIKSQNNTITVGRLAFRLAEEYYSGRRRMIPSLTFSPFPLFPFSPY